MKKTNFWKTKKIVVTGGAGFLGRHVIKLLKEINPKKITIIHSKDCDLRIYENCLKAFANHDMVIHLAANVGGIGYNLNNPASLFEDNLIMGFNCMKAARKVGVSKFVAIGTVCAYPKYLNAPFKEEDLWMGYPEESNAPYGLAKKMLLVQAQAYRRQYGFNAIYLLPVNLYGKYDNFNPKSSHVIPSLMRKLILAKKRNRKTICVWGSGTATREFLYVEDCARAILLAAEKYDKEEPVNLGTGKETTINELVNTLKKLIYPGVKIVWDKTKPDGQPQRVLNVEKAKKEFGFTASTSLNQGLRKTLSWYIKQPF